MSWGWDEIKVPWLKVWQSCYAVILRVMSGSHGALQCLENETRSHQNAKTLCESLLDMRCAYTHNKIKSAISDSQLATPPLRQATSAGFWLNFFFARHCVSIGLLTCKCAPFVNSCVFCDGSPACTCTAKGTKFPLLVQERSKDDVGAAQFFSGI